MKLFVFLLFLLGVCAGCRPPYSDIRLKRKVEEAEVVGVWLLRQDSLERAKEEGAREGFAPTPGERYSIEIRSNHSCHFSSLRQMPLRREDCEGTWHLEFEKDGHRPNQLWFELKIGAGYMFALEFTTEENRVVLWDYLGDPDDWQFLKYEKEPIRSQSQHAGVGPFCFSYAATPMRSSPTKRFFICKTEPNQALEPTRGIEPFLLFPSRWPRVAQL